MQTEITRELHIFPYARNSFVIFHPITRLFFRANPRTARILRAYARGDCLERIASTESRSGDQIEKLISGLEAIIGERLEAFSATPPQFGQKICGKLTLHVSNDCNMRCRYCYGEGGGYGMPRRLMTGEMAVQCLRRFYEQYSQIASIMFFGGEPLLNLSTIRTVCEHLVQLVRDAPAIKFPRLGMVSNMSYIPPGLSELIGRFKIGVTASLDGPQTVNDANRFFRSGRGTFSTVSENIRRLKSATGQPTMIEATFTNQHVEQQYSVSDLARYFAEAFQICSAEIALACVPQGHPSRVPDAAVRQLQRDQRKLIQANMEDLGAGHKVATLNEFHQTLGLLVRNSRTFDFHCVAGVEDYAVSADGYVYPCQMFVGIQEFCMGNVQDPHLFEGSRFNDIRERFADNRKSTTQLCRNCWARNLCFACPGKAYREVGTIRVAATLNCTVIKRSVEHLLAQLARVNADPATWGNFLASITGPWEKRSDGPEVSASPAKGSREAI